MPVHILLNRSVGITLHHLPDIPGHVVETERVRRIALHRLQEFAPLGEGASAGFVVIRLARRLIGTPGISLAEVTGTCCKLEFRGRRQPIGAMLTARPPRGIVDRIDAIDKNYGMVL